MMTNIKVCREKERERKKRSLSLCETVIGRFIQSEKERRTKREDRKCLMKGDRFVKYCNVMNNVHREFVVKKIKVEERFVRL